MLGALPKAHERQLAGSAHGMTAMVEAEGMARRAPAALIGAGGGGGRRQQKKGCSGSSRVVRGGSWYDFPSGLRSANRDRVSPGFHDIGVGLRLARTLLSP